MRRDELEAAIVRLRHDLDVEGMVHPDDGPPDWFTLHHADVALVLEFVEEYMPAWSPRRALDDDLTVERFRRRPR